MTQNTRKSNAEYEREESQKIISNKLTSTTGVKYGSLGNDSIINQQIETNMKGNFIEKFLALTYMLDDVDFKDDNIKTLESILKGNFRKLTAARDRENSPFTWND